MFLRVGRCCFAEPRIGKRNRRGDGERLFGENLELEIEPNRALQKLKESTLVILRRFLTLSKATTIASLSKRLEMLTQVCGVLELLWASLMICLLAKTSLMVLSLKLSKPSGGV